MSDARIIRLISRNFVPVAVNLYELRDTKTSAAKLYRSIHKQKPQYQGYWIVSPKTKVIYGQVSFKSQEAQWPQEMLTNLQKVLQKIDPPEARSVKLKDLFPYRGNGVRKDGSVQMGIYVRRVLGQGKFLNNGIIDSVKFSKKEFDSFAPPRIRVGLRWRVPDDVSRKFARCLSPSSDLVSMPLPKEVDKVNLVGEVQSVNGDMVTLTYTGYISAVHKHLYDKDKTNRGYAKVEGVAKYDDKNKELRSIKLVLDGTFYDFQPYHREPRRFLGAVEWTRKKVEN
ncbi:MAG: hypothetical protein ACFCD0_06645 [Gemmataceae bacterium]